MSEVMVRVRRDPVLWGRLPADIRAELTDGIARVGRIRANIAQSAKVSSLPPVHGLAELWVVGESTGFANGRSTSLRVGKRVFFGAELPAHTLLCTDERTVRRVLVHEFAHCFEFYVRFVDAVGKGMTELTPASEESEEAHEHALLGDPGAWFGDEDAADFATWNDDDLCAQLEPVFARLRERRCFPIVNASRTFATAQISIPLDVRAVAEQVVTSRRPEHVT